MFRTTAEVAGMICGMCEAHINDAVRKAFSVKKVSSSRTKGETVIESEQPIDPEKTYTIASTDYYLLDNGDGFTAFNGAEILQDQFKLDSQLLIDYIVDDLGGVIGEEYADPYGQGRIVIVGR